MLGYPQSSEGRCIFEERSIFHKRFSHKWCSIPRKVSKSIYLEIPYLIEIYIGPSSQQHAGSNLVIAVDVWSIQLIDFNSTGINVAHSYLETERLTRVRLFLALERRLVTTLWRYTSSLLKPARTSRCLMGPGSLQKSLAVPWSILIGPFLRAWIPEYTMWAPVHRCFSHY